MKKYIIIFMLIVLALTLFGCSRYINLEDGAVIKLTVNKPQGVDIEVVTQYGELNYEGGIYRIEVEKKASFGISISAPGYHSEVINITENDLAGGVYDLVYDFGRAISKDLTVFFVNNDSLDISLSQTEGSPVDYTIANNKINMKIPNIYSTYKFNISSEGYSVLNLDISEDNMYTDYAFWLQKEGNKQIKISQMNISDEVLVDNHIDYYQPIIHNGYAYYSVRGDAFIKINDKIVDMSSYGRYEYVIKSDVNESYNAYKFIEFENIVDNYAIVVTEDGKCQKMSYEKNIFLRPNGVSVPTNAKRIIIELENGFWYDIDLSSVTDKKIYANDHEKLSDRSCIIKVYNDLTKEYVNDFRLEYFDENIIVNNGIYDGVYKNYNCIVEESIYLFPESLPQIQYDFELQKTIYELHYLPDIDVKIKIRNSQNDYIDEPLMVYNEEIIPENDYYTIRLQQQSNQNFYCFSAENNNYISHEYIVCVDKIQTIDNENYYMEDLYITDYQKIYAYIVKDNQTLYRNSYSAYSDECILSYSYDYDGECLLIKTKKDITAISIGGYKININVNELTSKIIYIDYNEKTYEELYLVTPISFEAHNYSSMEIKEGFLLFSYGRIMTTNNALISLDGEEIVLENMSQATDVFLQEGNVYPVKEHRFTCIDSSEETPVFVDEVSAENAFYLRNDYIDERNKIVLIGQNDNLRLIIGGDTQNIIEIAQEELSSDYDNIMVIDITKGEVVGRISNFEHDINHIEYYSEN